MLFRSHREVQPRGAAGERVISQHVVFVRKSKRILLTIPFQLIGSRVCGAAEKAGQHGVALHCTFNGGILAENLTVQRMVGTDIFRYIVFALDIGVHMIKLAVTFAHDGFPNKKLGSDISGHLVCMVGIRADPAGIGVALPAIGHDPPDIFLDGAGRYGGIEV